MSKRFIPRGDDAFSEMAEAFALRIAREREQLGVSEDDSAALSAAAADFKARLFETRFGSGRGFAATQRKCEARREAERLINRMAAILRVSDAISPQDKERLRLHERPRRGKGPELPSEPPRLKFKRARHEGTGVAPLHELEFAEYHTLARTKPAGAARIELFVDLVPPEEPAPAYPGANGGRPWYLRSYTRNPIVLTPPMARVPMRVVYWGRWADATGNVGPFSETVVGWVEGGAHLPALAPALHHTKQLKLLEDVGPRALPEGPESVYVVAVMQAQYESLMRALPALPESGEGVATSTAALPAPAREVLQIEGPREDAAEERVAA